MALSRFYSHLLVSEHVLLCVQHLIPEPCSEAYIAEVEEWMETPEVRSKEEVMADEFGEVAVAGPLAGEVCTQIKFLSDTHIPRFHKLVS